MTSRRFSRRSFLRNARWSPLLYLPSPLSAGALDFLLPPSLAPASYPISFADSRLSPRYPFRSPLDEMLRLVAPGADAYVSEKYAFDISKLLDRWSAGLKSYPPALETLAEFLHPFIEFNSLSAFNNKNLAHNEWLNLQERQFHPGKIIRRALFITAWKTHLSSFSEIHTAEFQITRLNISAH